MDCPSTPAAPLFALTRLYGLPYQLLRYLKRLDCRTRLVHSSPPRSTPGCSCDQDTDEPAPSLHPHYKGFSTTTSWSAGAPRIGTRRLTVSAARRTPSRARPHPLGPGGLGPRLPAFSVEARIQTHAACMPDTDWPISGHPPASSRDCIETPVSMSLPTSRHFISGSLSFVFLVPHLTALTLPFPRRSPRRSSANAARGGLTPPPTGRRRRATTPPSSTQHRTKKQSQSLHIDSSRRARRNNAT